MEGAWDAGPIVVAELPDTGSHVFQVFGRDLLVGEKDLPSGKPRLGLSSEVEHDLKQIGLVVQRVDRPPDVGRERREEQL
jgi:hypothetical protein